MLVQLQEPGHSDSNNDEKVQAIGIDLGTTYTVVAFSQNQKTQLIPVDSNFLLPSRVFSNKNLSNNAKYVSSFKRFMQTPSEVVFDHKNAVQLSAEILKKVKQSSEEFLGYEVNQAVITVPAYFDETARQATKDAAMLAGLKVLRLINEPTSAALAYGLNHNAQGIYLVYDFGGGTFDISVLKLKDSFFQVIATLGDLNLGGDNIDASIVEFWQKQNQVDLPNEQLKNYAREAKEYLLENDSWKGSLEALYLTRIQLEELSQPYIERTLKLCDEVLQDAQIEISHINGIVLVGGSTRLYLLHEKIEKHFSIKPLTNLNPDQIVALGAAIQAESLTYGSKTLLLDVTPLSLGLETMGGLVEKIIPRNSPIPTSIAQDFTTYQDNQTSIKIHVVQGEREFVKDCRSLAEFKLDNIPLMRAGAPRIRVTFSIDADGLLNVTAQEQTSQVYQSIHITPSYGLSIEELEKMLYESMEHGQEDLEKRLLQESKTEAEQIIYFVEHAIAQEEDLLKEDEKEILIQAIKLLKSHLSSHNRNGINDGIKNLSKLSQPFAEKRIERAIRQKILGTNVASNLAE